MSDRSLQRRDILALGGTAVSTALAGCSLSTLGNTNAARPAADPPEPNASDPETEYTRLYRDALPSVVLIETGSGRGTGFVYDDSYLVTNAHVVGQASTVDVRFSEGRWAGGDVLGRDPHSDLAAIAVDDAPANATPLPLIDGDATVGQEVVAIGNPYSLDGTVTTGIVSGIDRSIPAPTGFSIPDAIQTDAPVNPGNSGGPLMSLSGNVVAVINSGGGDNIAFGISGALTRRVVPSLIETGDYDHSYLGVSFDTVSPAVAEANGLEESTGLLVVETVSGGPADGALRPSSNVRVVDGERVPVGGDVIRAIDGTEVATSEDLGSYLALRTRPGDAVSLSILREGREDTVEVDLGVRPART
ncbi:S1C family serine protease [Halovivax limisalsi]|uniref:S1C family serine protease n=1 Tax=Halovivax limisalsi TaxID=1453760 RepID=UPI001FFC51C8|nr:trypsin-like peptidase domain-containing protein [Halovivax limisalsi]